MKKIYLVAKLHEGFDPSTPQHYISYVSAVFPSLSGAKKYLGYTNNKFGLSVICVENNYGFTLVAL